MSGKWENLPKQNKEEGEEALEQGLRGYAEEGIEELESYLERAEQGLEDIEGEEERAKAKENMVRGFGKLLFLEAKKRREGGREEIVKKLKEFAEGDRYEAARDAAVEVLDKYYKEIESGK